MLPSRILLDTNIIQYLGDERLGSALSAHLDVFLGDAYDLAISQITILEALENVPQEVESARLDELARVSHMPVAFDVLNIAAELGSLYAEEDPNRKIDSGDKIIAATAAIAGCGICTGNAKDFPYPFFDFSHVAQVGYEKDGRDCCQVIYYLVPNQELIARRIIKRKMAPAAKKGGKTKAG